MTPRPTPGTCTSTATSSATCPPAATSRRARTASSTPPSAPPSTRPASWPASSTACSTRSASGTSPAPRPRSRPTKNQELTSGTGLIARYGLNEGSGVAVNNSVAGAPANTNGTAVNGPLWVSGFPPPVSNQPPVFSTEFTDRTDAEGAVISLDANATDPDAGTTLVYSRHRPARWHHHQQLDWCLQRHAVGDELGQLQHGHHRHRRHAHRHRQLHLDGDQHQPATGLQHRVHGSHRRRGCRHQPRRRRHPSRPGDTLTYRATNLPAGVSIAPSTGVISGTLTIASAGTYNVVVTVSDGTSPTPTASPGR